MNDKKITVIGAGLAGCEAAWQIAKAGLDVELWEMKPQKFTPAHKYGGFAELVCSNSLKAARLNSAAGLLKEEMRRLGSLTVPCAEETAVPAGGALAVDREKFSDLITEKITANPRITVKRGEVSQIPEGNVIIATGPLTGGGLAENIEKLCGGYLSFHDAAAPIVTYQSLDKEKIFFAARYGRGEDDYINCPFTKEEYTNFWQELKAAQSAPLHDFDGQGKDGFTVYEGCMPIEVLAKRGEETMRYGAMKPVGLTDPATGKRPYAVVQLRKENSGGTLYNIVGFQTNLKFGEQKRVFSMIPGLANAEFVRYGVMHRNSFINSPKVLNGDFSLRTRPSLFFAGQITGVEGYMESAASGIMAGLNMARRLRGLETLILPRKTMVGALARYISDETVTNFQPMGANMGLLPELDVRIRDKQERYQKMAERSVDSLQLIVDSL
ncbi:MAG: methylenetetrahydrofolate--tRNA-(uracil(54)-C(5))-methyltransferase (FADH(2)-oxidizing) TrmFO [Ruminococcus sp.]|nr:methylenetetrahydrofolate--tRNA-(uracil(54)-C(5))-methyltransferase (FADH(2)-oxidizing) TrmFO [Ruminococcus sp.]MCM1479471.1 methylenetetrahydrofolate--tRNA-(uracil(54)-C(5))-methyltransferase (FADH(2)-oxidizing) TrmFO [Muribaculaceae bacterium]